MAIKKATYYFDSDNNQLPYQGSPATYCDGNSSDVLTITEDRLFDNDGVPVFVNSFSFRWLPISKLYSPVYVKYRVLPKEGASHGTNWSIPTTVYTAVRYAIYKRRVSDPPNQWTLVEVTKSPAAGPYKENWAGRVQYAVGIWHREGKPEASEGVGSATSFTNRYILFATDPTSTTMNTNRFVV